MFREKGPADSAGGASAAQFFPFPAAVNHGILIPICQSLPASASQE
jgi:hypothetical protein